MSTGVVVNGYEIRNWHTVSILELARARREQGQPVPVEKIEKVQKKKLAKRSKGMSKKVEISEEQARAWAIAYERDRASMSSLSRASGVSAYIIGRRIDDYLKANPDFATKLDQLKLTKEPDLSTKVDAPDCNTTVLHPGHAAAADVMRQAGFDESEIKQAIAADAPPAPDEQMDEPEAVMPSTEIVVQQALARSRARELHTNAGDSRVVAVQELPSPLLARKQYSVPRILESGSMIDVANPHAAAKLVEGLVARLNEVPGVQAYFEWRAEGRTGQPLGR